MLDNWLIKSKLEKSVEKVVKNAFLGKISPNQMTLLGLFFGMLSTVFIFLSGFNSWSVLFIALGVTFMVISFVFDAFDGILARLSETSKFGGILDMFCDRTVETFIIIGIISTNPTLLMWPGIFSLASIILCITMFLVVGGTVKVEELEKPQKIIYYRKGLMERSETFLFLLVIILIIALRWLLLWIFSGLIFLTAFLRLYDAYKIFNPSR